MPCSRRLAGLVVLLAACQRAAEAPPAANGTAHGSASRYVGAQPVGTYPATPATIRGWIESGDTRAIRAHGWDIWAAITATAHDSTPVWQTWYSGHELFEDTMGVGGATRAHAHLLPIEHPRQFAHATLLGTGHGRGGIPRDLAERVFAFNRFTEGTARYIAANGLNLRARLADTLVKMELAGRPLAQREVLVSQDSVDAASFVIKPVFLFIAKDSVSAIPYWDGYDRQHTSGDTLHPPPRFWRQAVAVDPTGRLRAGDSVFMAFNQEPKRWLRVVPLGAFYHRVVSQAEADSLTTFGSENGDDLGFASDTSDAAVRAAAQPGNVALLMAMHVTGKEIVNWTWQSFWWSPLTNDPRYGADRPASIPAPWNNYLMTVAYAMQQPDGSPLVAFNPYLETSLFGPGPGANEPNMAPWTGVGTNCMSCHRRAAVAYRTLPPHNGLQPGFTDYGPAGMVDAGDTTVFMLRAPGWLGATLKTDFLWSVAIRARDQGAAPPPAAAPASAPASAKHRGSTP
jgi:hypothetical protein